MCKVVRFKVENESFFQYIFDGKSSHSANKDRQRNRIGALINPDNKRLNTDVGDCRNSGKYRVQNGNMRDALHNIALFGLNIKIGSSITIELPRFFNAKMAGLVCIYLRNVIKQSARPEPLPATSRRLQWSRQAARDAGAQRAPNPLRPVQACIPAACGRAPA